MRSGRLVSPGADRAAATLVALAMSGAGLLPAAAPVTAQEMASLDAGAIRAVMMNGLEQHRLMDVDFVRAIPDSALRWAPTDGVRDFAQQIEHIVLDNVMFVHVGVLGQGFDDQPSFGDREVYLNDKRALERLVDATYGWVKEHLADLSDAKLLEATELFGQPMTNWRVFLMALQHADWTRGQLVPYYRMNGVQPPEWRSY